VIDSRVWRLWQTFTNDSIDIIRCTSRHERFEEKHDRWLLCLCREIIQTQFQDSLVSHQLRALQAPLEPALLGLQWAMMTRQVSSVQICTPMYAVQYIAWLSSTCHIQQSFWTRVYTHTSGRSSCLIVLLNCLSRGKGTTVTVIAYNSALCLQSGFLLALCQVSVPDGPIRKSCCENVAY